MPYSKMELLQDSKTRRRT